MPRTAQLLGALATIAVGLSACGAASAAQSAAPARPPSRPAACRFEAPTRVAANPWAAARVQLAPATPTALRLCRYSGLNANQPRRLIASVLVDSRSTLRSLTHRFDQLASAQGTFGCPLDDGSEIVARLAYPGPHQVTISVGLRGCNSVTNGDLHRTAAGAAGRPGPKLLAQLERLTS